MLGCRYTNEGLGLPKYSNKALELVIQAEELGSIFLGVFVKSYLQNELSNETLVDRSREWIQ